MYRSLALTLPIVSVFYQGHAVLFLELIKIYLLISIKIGFLTLFFQLDC